MTGPARDLVGHLQRLPAPGRHGDVLHPHRAGPALDQVDGEAVRQRELLGARQRRGRSDARLGHLVAPRLLRLHLGGTLGGRWRGGRARRQHLLARQHLDHDPLVLGERLGGQRLHLVRGHRRVALEVLVQVSGVAGELVVGLESVRHPTEPADIFETGDDAGADRGLGGRQLLGRRPARRERIQLVVDRRLQLVRGVTRLGGRPNLEVRIELRRLLEGGHVLGDLLLVHQALVEPARLAAAQDAGRDVGFGVTGLEVGSRDPRHVDARQLHLVGHHLAPLGADRRRLHVDRRHVGALGDGAEVFLDQRLGLVHVDVARDGQRGVVGRVVLGEEVTHVLELGGLDVRVGADHVGVVGMSGRVEQVRHRLLGEAVGAVLDALAPLVAHHVLLVRQHSLVEAVEQEAHPIALEPQRQLELVRWHVLEEVGAIEVGGSVHHRGAGSFQVLEVLVLAHVTRALEHHVLEQVREAGLAGGLLGGPDVVPQVDRGDR